MANKTKIEWCRTYRADGSFTEGYTVNPIRFRPHGSAKTTTMCQIKSPGCQQCYAASIVKRFWPSDSLVQFKGYTAQGIESGEFVLDEKQLQSVLKIKKPCRIFWVDMADIFHERVPFWMVDACLAVCALTPHITHMFLTKRPERMAEYFVQLKKAADDWAPQTKHGAFTPSNILNLRHLARHTIDGRTYAVAFPHHPWPLPNVWLGTSCETQKYADERIPLLLKSPAVVHFISAEPLLGPIDLTWPETLYPDGPPMCCDGRECGCMGLPTDPPLLYGIDLVIVGGESGRSARSCNINWIRSIVKDCKQWNTAVFVKQLGSNPLVNTEEGVPLLGSLDLSSSKGGDIEEWPSDLRIRQFPETRQ